MEKTLPTYLAIRQSNNHKMRILSKSTHKYEFNNKNKLNQINIMYLKRKKNGTIILLSNHSNCKGEEQKNRNSSECVPVKLCRD